MMYQYKYPRASITVDSLVFMKENDALMLLLIKRKNDPFKDCWAFPGGFLDMDETLETAVGRELEEETCLKGIEFTQLKTYSSLDRDPRGRTISTAFIGFTTLDNCQVKGADDAAEAKWFNTNNLPSLAFDHKEIIEDALKRIHSL
ncbi:MAG: NUDIX hydrolase [Marinifilaceae bacterium]